MTSLLPVPRRLRRRRQIGRYREIAEVLTRHGFGAVVAQLGLDRRLRWRRGRLDPADLPAPDERAARRLRRVLEDLGPTFVKLGQLLAARPDLLPPAYISELAQLHDRVPPVTWDEVSERIETELGRSVDELFDAIDSTPMASASLAQVHAATLHDGTEVVVKVQRPGIAATIEQDLDIAADLASLVQQRIVPAEAVNVEDLVQEFAAGLREELDYRREGRNVERFRANFASEQHLYVPAMCWSYTTRRVLVQERVRGIKINDTGALDEAGYDRMRIAEHSARLVLKEVLEDGFFHADPHPGNLMIMPGEVIGLIDFGTVGHLSAAERANLVRLYVTVVQMDVDTVVDELIRMGIAESGVDRHSLRRDLRRVLLSYRGRPLKEIAVREVLEEVEPVIYRHRLRVPADLWLLIKTLVIMEGVGKQLAPEFDIFSFSEPYVRRFMVRMWSPATWGPAAVRSATWWTDLLTNFPRYTTRILGQLEHGGLELQVDVPQVDHIGKQIDQVANRIILGLLLAALVVGLAFLIPSLDLDDPGVVTYIIVISFGLAVGLAGWLVYSMLRSAARNW